MRGLILAVALAMMASTALGSGWSFSASGHQAAISYTPHSSISILGDEGFTLENGVVSGSGTAGDPYIIEGWSVNASLSNGISIADTTAFFVVRNVWVYDGEYSYDGFEALDGVRLDNVRNGTVSNVLAERCRYGISAWNSIDVSISENIALNNSFGGIGVNNIQRTSITENYAAFNHRGIYLGGGASSQITNNTIYSNSFEGIDLLMSDSVTISSNVLSGNGNAILVEMSHSCLVEKNVILDDTYSGIYMYFSSDDVIRLNDVNATLDCVRVQNSSGLQVYHNTFRSGWVWFSDSGANQWDDGYPSGGNYWWWYTGTDMMQGPEQDELGSDGIGDDPIILSTDNVDNYPLMMPYGSPPPPPPLEPGEPVMVSNGTSVTVFEQTGWIYSYTYDLYTLTHGGGSFFTVAMLTEQYTVSSDGTYLTVQCYREPPYPCSGTAVGNNIVAVRLNGIPGYPEGIWASFIVDYTLGVEGTAESRFNALGDDMQLGPYLNSHCTYLGDYHSELVLGFAAPTLEPPTPPLEASLDFDMNSWNVKSKGNSVTAYIGLPAGYDVEDIDVGSVVLNDQVSATRPSEILDFDDDGKLELMVKFNRSDALATLTATKNANVTVSGHLVDGTEFLGVDTITIRHKTGLLGLSLLGMDDPAIVGLMIALMVTAVSAVAFIALGALRTRSRKRSEEDFACGAMALSDER